MLLTVICAGCGKKGADSKESNSNRTTENQPTTTETKEEVTKDFNVSAVKIGVYFGGEEYTGENVDDIRVLTAVLDGMTKVDSYNDLEGGYNVNLYVDDNIKYEIVVIGNEIRLMEGEDRYLKEISAKESSEIVEMLKVYYPGDLED
ncbi:MAG: hypothetical protein GX225_03625 [Clostridiales bacterium]|nr:hypothetical protein [Clostridiales bacterium]